MVTALFILTFIFGFFSGIVFAFYLGWRWKQKEESAERRQGMRHLNEEERMATYIAERLIAQREKDILS